MDTYGGAAPHGGGAFLKGSTKVDRSAAYASRYLAKNIVAAGFLKNVNPACYAIGVPKPLSIFIKLAMVMKIKLIKLKKLLKIILTFHREA